MSEKNRTLFSFTKMNKYYLIPFVAPLFCFTCNFLSQLMKAENRELNLNLFLFPILNFLSDIIAGFLYFIQLSKNKYKTLVSKRSEKEKKNKCKIFWIIIFMSFLKCSKYICLNINEELFLFLPFTLNLIFAIIFTKFLLKINIYNHQILSIIISFIGFIFILFSNIKTSLGKFYIFIIISLLNATFISILKYSITIYFISPFLCSFLYGIISIIIYLVGIIIYSLYKFKNFSFIQDIYAFSNKMFVIYYSLKLIATSILKALTLLEVYYFSPILYFISESLSQMIFSLYIKFYLKNNGQSIYIYILIIIGSLFEIISILLYNEIIIFNCFALNRNTVKYIKEREIEEKLDALYDDEKKDKNGDDNSSNDYLEIANYKINLHSRTNL